MEERFLFELATTRATRELYLSYPQIQSKGEENLPSFFLRDVTAVAVPSRRARPAPARGYTPSRPAVIEAPDLLAALAKRHTRMGPTTVEKYLACPFQFFASKTLALAEPPVSPQERLDNLLSGTVVHAVLERWSQDPNQRLAPLFDEVFAEHCREAGVAQGFRTESIRLDMLRDLESGVPLIPRIPGWTGAWAARLPDATAGGLHHHGADGSVRSRFVGPRAGDRLQVQRQRAPVSHRVRGWQPGAGGPVSAGRAARAGRHSRRDVGSSRCDAAFMSTAGTFPSRGSKSAARLAPPKCWSSTCATPANGPLDMIAQLRAGRIDPAPGLARKCYYCDHAEVCRSEASVVQIAGGGA